MTSCDPAKYLDKYDSEWYVKNNTSKVLTITADVGLYRNIDHDILFPGDSISIIRFGKFSYLEEYPAFSDFPECENVHVEVYSENGDLMLSWENNTETGKQSDFFKEESWRYFHTEDFSRMWWVYDINPEDLDASMKE